MENLTPRERDDLLLGYEDTTGAEREALDAWLARDPAAARRLHLLQATERATRDELPIASAAWNEMPDTGIDPEARDASLRRVLAELVPRPQAAHSTWRRHAAWALPLAAALALLVLWPHGDKALFRDLHVAAAGRNVGGVRGGETARTDGVLHTGQSFALEFDLSRPAWVVIYHVDPAGRVARVFPVDLDDPAAMRAAGRQTVPEPGGEDTWVLGSETGVESFLVASATARPDGLDGIRVAPAGADRAGIVSDLQEQLEELADQVQLIEFVHED